MESKSSGQSSLSTRSEPIKPVMMSSSHHPFQSAMSEFTDVSPGKLAFYLFSKNVIEMADYEQTNMKLSESSISDYDSEELNMALLTKVYHVLKENPEKINAVCSALEKFKDKKDIIQKLAIDSKICKSKLYQNSTELITTHMHADMKRNLSGSIGSSVCDDVRKYLCACLHIL